MTTQTLDINPPKVADATSPESGVIKDAQRRRRRERTAASLLFLALIGAGLFVVGQGHGAQIARQNSASPRWMSGPPLSSSTHLRLLVSQNGGRPWIVDVPSGRVHTVAGLGLPRVQSLWRPMLWPLTRVQGGALGVVVRRPCNSCTATETHYLISPAGSVMRLIRFRLGSHQSATTPVYGSSTAIWVLTHPRSGPCTLSEEPGSAAAVTVPCGDPANQTVIGPDTQAGLVVSTSSRTMLVDPRTGQVRARSPAGGQLDVLSRNIVLTGGPTGIQGQAVPPPPLLLVNLATGATRQLRWPSVLRFNYEVFPDPRSSLVAVEFADPAYKMSSRQASDIWLLNTRTGAFTHVPGFPIFEYLKVSGMAWTSTHRLVVIAYGLRHVSIGIWRPGSSQMHVGTVPSLSGYLEFVPFQG